MILTKRPDDSAALVASFDPHPQPDCEQSIEAQFIDAGVPPQCLADVRRVHVNECIRRNGESLRRLLILLDGTPAGIALQRVVLGADASLTEDAARVGITKQSLDERCQRLQKHLPNRPLTAGDLFE